MRALQLELPFDVTAAMLNCIAPGRIYPEMYCGLCDSWESGVVTGTQELPSTVSPGMVKLVLELTCPRCEKRRQLVLGDFRLEELPT